MIKVYDSGASFIEENRPVLEASPLENGFWFIDARFMDTTDKRNYVLSAVDGQKRLLCMRPLPYNMMLLGDGDLIGELLDYLLAGGYEVDSVLCNEELGALFTAYMSDKKGIEYYEALAMDYMESATRYAPTDPETERALETDAPELCGLLNLFAEECGLEERCTLEEVSEGITDFRIIRRSGEIAALAKSAEDTERARRISDVYTRVPYRNKGLAGKVVNAVKNDILDAGFIADLNVNQRNPVTNHLYRKLGFERVFAQGQYRIAKLETDRLILRPLCDADMEKLISETDSVEMKLAYGEMLALCKANPRDRIFGAVWVMERKEDGIAVGDLCFKGLDEHGMVEIGYGTYEPYRNLGYMTEAVIALTKWALAQGSVKRVEAEAETGNAASLRVLTKAGYVPTGETGPEGPRFVWKG